MYVICTSAVLLPIHINDFFRSATLKKVRSLKVLEPKASQNLSILLGGSLKHLSYADVKRAVLKCDDTVLKGNVLDQLINYLPPPDQLKKLRDLECPFEELVEAEQFAVTVSIKNSSIDHFKYYIKLYYVIINN